MAKDDPQVNFRLPAELRAQLQQAADFNKRTLTQEIVQRLLDSFRNRPSATAHDAMLQWIYYNASHERQLALIKELGPVDQLSVDDRRTLARLQEHAEEIYRRMREVEELPEFPAYRVGIYKEAR